MTMRPSSEYALNQNMLVRPAEAAGKQMRCTAEFRRPLTGEVASLNTDCSGFITAWSLSAERMYGFDYDEIIGKHISILYCHSDLLHGRAAYELKAASSRGNYCASGWQQRKNSQQFFTYSESKKIEDGYLMLVMEIPASGKLNYT